MSGSSPLPSPGPAFEARKLKILEQLAVPDAEYSDASPKGTVDVGIRPLLAEINAAAGFVTTSSCAGRVSVFVEGRKTAAATTTTATGDDQDDVNDGSGGTEQSDGLGPMQPVVAAQTVAGLGGKGGGGTWLYVSHDPHPLAGQGVVVDWAKELGITGKQEDELLLDTTGGSGGCHSERRLIHFKFEPMILHVLTASHAHAQLLLRCALHAGFRESGAVSLVSSNNEPATPMVAVRSMGLGLESLLGYAEDDGRRRRLTVPPGYLDTLMTIGSARFAENAKRIERFETAFGAATARLAGPRRNPDGGAWEDAAARRERMRAEGLRQKAARQAERRAEEEQPDIDLTGTMG
ncbi:hypothetical protein MY5147_006216 [Beauveria neobassiana]|uniref:tRNA(Phe) 7-[(3-amino-3-carboxypropyl)-4-demethylwyosine(37)-N(4)]-methyltransferase n=1 Tax=Beauveria bassiana D1-5 TaxID=1245745 RepID=A0A0A2VQ26_BEABA|nr:tRNA wybutosine-synthesizing protein 3 [Beauveria bassiana D1-5]